MRRIVMPGLGLALAAGLLAGCEGEFPSSLGGEVLSEQYRTFEVVFEASEFLQRDTTYDGIGLIQGAPFALVANAFEGELDAHTVFRVTPPPESITYTDADGTTITDSLYTLAGATVTLVLDSLRDDQGRVGLELLEVTESWDARSATWEQRVDTADVTLPWTEPGGTTGQQLGQALTEQGDTVRISLSAQAAAVWADSAGAFHGGLIRATTPGTRLRIESIVFDFEARPTAADTVLTVGSTQGRVTLVTPAASTPDSGELRVGGVPTWRSALEFRPLADLPIPCTPESMGCTLPLSRVDVNFAALVLGPVPVGARRIERPIRVEGRALLRGPGVPLTRSPLTPALGRMRDPLEPMAFTVDPAEPVQAVVPITSYVRRNVDPAEGEDPILWLALLAELERASPVFGYGVFGSITSATPPELRLVVTVPAGEGGL